MTATVPAYPVRTKTAAEEKTLTFDFTPELAPGTTLTGTPLVEVEGAPATSTLAAGNAQLDVNGVSVTVLVTGGAMGEWGTVSVLCGASDGQLHEITVVVEIGPA
jgi:UDP-N-acetylglucosamine:LPS N-acetylglucosamine transferase